MKRNLFLFAALLAACTLFNLEANAQDNRTISVPVTITLTDAFSITLNNAPGAVAFAYGNAASYAASQSVTKTNHFTIISNKAYNVGVTASAFTPALGLDIVQVNIDPATTPPAGTTYSTVPLTGGTLITAGPATTGTSYNVIYSIPNAATLVGKQTTTPYTTNVTYTITQP